MMFLVSFSENPWSGIHGDSPCRRRLMRNMAWVTLLVSPTARILQRRSIPGWHPGGFRCWSAATPWGLQSCVVCEMDQPMNDAFFLFFWQIETQTLSKVANEVGPGEMENLRPQSWRCLMWSDAARKPHPHRDIYILTYCLTYILTYYLTFFLIFWHIIRHFTWHSFSQSLWQSIWHSIWHFNWHPIWHSMWHSIWHICWQSLFYVFLTF